MGLPSQVVQSRLRLRGFIRVHKVDAGIWTGGDFVPICDAQTLLEAGEFEAARPHIFNERVLFKLFPHAGISGQSPEFCKDDFKSHRCRLNIFSDGWEVSHRGKDRLCGNSKVQSLDHSGSTRLAETKFKELFLPLVKSPNIESPFQGRDTKRIVSHHLFEEEHVIFEDFHLDYVVLKFVTIIMSYLVGQRTKALKSNSLVVGSPSPQHHNYKEATNKD
uniref:Predicted protein n=1 Tax=Physcomitrium patens TaxID=3218 RepID=A9TZN8_PHYPA